MMIYVLYFADYDEFLILGVFSSKEKAENHKETLADNKMIDIMEIELDKPLENWTKKN